MWAEPTGIRREPKRRPPPRQVGRPVVHHGRRVLNRGTTMQGVIKSRVGRVGVRVKARRLPIRPRVMPYTLGRFNQRAIPAQGPVILYVQPRNQVEIRLQGRHVSDEKLPYAPLPSLQCRTVKSVVPQNAVIEPDMV